VFDWVKKKEATSTSSLTVDIHSHLLPGLDDGVKSFDESLTIIQYFQEAGYKKLVITPHVISDLYRNSAESIISRHEQLKECLKQNNVIMETEVAAEYYLDESLFEKLNKGEKLLTIGAPNYLLFETNFMNEPFTLNEFIFIASTKKYKPVLAHPERYLYLHDNLGKCEELLNRGVLFQVNLNSLTGHYSKPAQSLANKLIDRGWVHFLGSDCHHIFHAQQLLSVRQNKYFQKALHLPLLNNTLS
jgi:protein-tyrosine phosphatase